MELKLIIVILGKPGAANLIWLVRLEITSAAHGYTVKYYRITELLLEIQEQKTNTGIQHL